MTPFLGTSVFLAGAATLGAEVAAPRLLAPSFGTTQLVWTNVIGTVLVALTLGGFVGGRLADRWPSERAYGRVLVLAGLLLAAIPVASPPILERAAAALAGRAVGSFLLSLAAASLFFAPPVFLLGMVGPWAVRLAGIARLDLGRVTGAIYGLGALGSIVGTFGTTLVALPLLGTRRTLLAMAALLVAAGALRAVRPRARLLGLVAGMALALLPLPSSRARPGLVHETESLYQLVQVTIDRAGWTRLLVNEGIGVQSIRPAQEIATGGVWDSLTALGSLVSEPGRDLRVLILGLGAGTVAAQLEALYADRRLSIDGVELDPAVVEAGRRFFGLDGLRSLRVHRADARAFVASAPGPYELVVVDAYRGFYVPFHLATREFFEACRGHLAPRGIVAVNVAADRHATALLDAFAATLRASLPHVTRFEVENETVPFSNFVFLGSREALEAPTELDSFPAALRDVVGAAMLRTWEEPKPSPAAWILTDDRAPVELLADVALVRIATQGSDRP